MSYNEVLQECYEGTIFPPSYFSAWDKGEFVEWCQLGTINDIESMIKVLLKHELYRIIEWSVEVIEAKEKKENSFSNEHRNNSTTRGKRIAYPTNSDPPDI